MTAAGEAVCEVPIMMRGLAAGGFWGAAIGAAAVLVIFAVPPGQWLAGIWVGVLVGAVVGALVGLISGLVLAVAEHPNPDGPAVRTDSSRRRTGFICAATPFLLLAVFTLPVPELLLFWIPVSLVSGTAGACLAPCVVRGRAPRG